VGDVRCDQGIALGGGMDGLGQKREAGILEQEAFRAGLQRAVHVLVEVEGGDDDDGEGIFDVGASEPSGGLDAVQVGHADVEQAHVGPQLTSQRDGTQSVGGLPDDLDVGLSVEDHAEPRPDDVLVVGDEHADGHVLRPFRGSRRCRRRAALRQCRLDGPASLGGRAAWTVPPSREVRSVMPSSPYPGVGSFPVTASPSSRTVRRTRSATPPTSTVTRVALRAWRIALVTAS
jgi:hypothetical protein